MGKTLEREDLGGAGTPLSERGPYPPNLPDPPRTSLHGNRRGKGQKLFFVFGTAVAVQGSFWNSAGGARDLQSAASRSLGGRSLGTRVRDCIAVNK